MSPKQKFWQLYVGGVIWLVILVWRHPSPFETEWAMTLLLLSPLVLIPLGLRLAFASEQDRFYLAATQFQFPTAILLALSFMLPAGNFAALLSLPWFVTTAIISLAGFMRILKRGVNSREELCVDAGLIYLVIGGGWAVLSRGNIRPLEFEPIIVLLTAIHFHYAGFLLSIFTGLAGKIVQGDTSRLAATGVIAGVPLVAAGITTTQLGLGTWLESLAALVLAGSGLMTAWLHWRLSRQSNWPSSARVLWSVTALSLAFSMILAALYGIRFYFPLTWLDIPWMRALHGTANALGFGLAGALAWHWSNNK
jgi:hypothetical protein